LNLWWASSVFQSKKISHAGLLRLSQVLCLQFRDLLVLHDFLRYVFQHNDRVIGGEQCSLVFEQIVNQLFYLATQNKSQILVFILVMGIGTKRWMQSDNVSTFVYMRKKLSQNRRS
jgi:hypothetical protein